MREIKFRIFDKNIPRDLTEIDLHIVSGEIVDWDYIKQTSYLTDALNGKYPIMQYTGLKDKNGKEIYEGDILQFNTDAPGVVDWFRGSWRVKTPPNYNGDVWRTSLWDATIDEYEIIGNIYENPELLEESK